MNTSISTSRLFFDFDYTNKEKIMGKLFEGNAVSTEMIAYQINDRFVDDLEAIIVEIKEGIEDGIYTRNRDIIDDYGKDIEKLIKKRFNIKFILEPKLSNVVPAAVIPFFTSDILGEKSGGWNVFSRVGDISKERERIAKALDGKEGYIDLKAAKVHGYLSELNNYFVFNFMYFLGYETGGITPRELVAIILHELGHAFEGLEYHYRVITGNLAILYVIDDLANNNLDQVKYKLNVFYKEKDLDASALSTLKTREDYYVHLCGEAMGDTVVSSMLNHNYDQSTFEYLADSFATRFGLGEELASGLLKLHSSSGDINVYDTEIRHSVMIGVMFGAKILLTTLLMLVGGALLTLVSIGIWMILFTLTGKKDVTYDTFRDRLNRIKRTIINQLKDKTLPKDLVNNLVSQIESIEKMVESSISYTEVWEEVLDKFHPLRSRKARYANIQKAIEDALNNPLFVQSAKLRSM